MSTTIRPTPTEVMADEPLFQRVQRDPEICTNCFRRFQQVYAINGVWLHGQDAGAHHLRDSIADIVTDERIPDEENPRVPKDLPSHGTRPVCRCGYPAGETNRPLDKRRFMEYGTRLFTRLQEHTAHDLAPRPFYRHLYTLKTDPAEQFADDRLYARAAQEALRRARMRGPHGTDADSRTETDTEAETDE